jgi:ferritin-like metal-binding protein YciE
MMADAEDDATRDALMIAAAQKVEHYEIASYGTVRTWAQLLGKSEVASLLEESLEEEKETDEKLTTIAEAYVNQQAADEGDEDEMDRPSTRRASTARSGRQQAAERGRRRSRRSR